MWRRSRRRSPEQACGSRPVRRSRRHEKPFSGIRWQVSQNAVQTLPGAQPTGRVSPQDAQNPTAAVRLTVHSGGQRSGSTDQRHAGQQSGHQRHRRQRQAPGQGRRRLPQGRRRQRRHRRRPGLRYGHLHRLVLRIRHRREGHRQRQGDGHGPRREPRRHRQPEAGRALQFGDVTIRLDQNNAAVTRADTATTTEDSSVVINVLANDKDFEGDALHISAINGQAIAVGGTVVLGDGSSVTLNANQTLTFNPNSAFQSLNGGEQAHEIFTYTVTDSQGASSAPTSVDVTVNGAWEAPTFFVNGEVDEKGQKPATEDVINGTGIPATGYQLVRADDAGIELGLQVHYRNGPVVLPTDGNGYADGVIKFQVADGPQTPATSPGFPAAPNRAAWSFDYSVITGLNGESTDLADFTFVFKVDIDPTAATNFQAFTMSPVGTGSAGVHWTNQFGDAVVDDNGILGEVAQNSRNLAFYDVDHVTPGTQP